MRQTAVEFLAENMLYLSNEIDMKFIDKNEYQAKRKDIIEQAKEMEKEQIKSEREEAYSNGYANGQKDAFTQ